MQAAPLLLEQSRQLIEQLLAGKAPHLAPLSPSLAQSPPELAFVNTFNLFLEKYQEAMLFIDAVSKGQLDNDPPANNQCIEPFKQLHSELRTLVWQTQRLAAGDLNQQVDFMGDFSTAFNSLIQSLRERQVLQERIFRSEEFYKTLARFSPDGIAVIDLNGIQTFVSEKGAKMFGYADPAEQVGKDFKKRIAPQHRPKALLLFDESLKGNYVGMGEYQVIHKDGSYFWIEANVEVLRNQKGDPEFILLVYRDINQKKQLEQQAQEYTRMVALQARTDRMTGLLNRSEGLEALEMEVRRSELQKTSLAVSFIDIDDLKYINDHFGHSEGDRMIMGMAACIQAHIRSSDHVSRMGGDEFLMIFPECDLQHAEGVISRLHESIAELNHSQGFEMPLSFSCGIVVSPPEKPISAEQLVRLADEQMYIQKREKKTRTEH